MTQPLVTDERRPAAAAAPAPHAAVDAAVLAARRRALTIGLLLTVTLAAFEMLAVATAMPIVGRDLGMLSLYGWVFSAYMLGELVGIVAAGLLIDRRGLVAPYVLGTALFALGLAIGGLAPNMPVLVAARAIQGIGAGAVPTTAYVAIQREYEPRQRPRMMFYLSAAWIVPGLVGPAIAGVVAEQLSWRAVFLGLLPLAAFAAALTIPALRALAGERFDEPDQAADEAPPTGARRLFGAVRVAVGAGLVLAALDQLNVLVAVALGIAGLVVGLPALIRLLPPGTLRARRGLPATVLLRGLLMFGFAGAESYVPYMLVTVRHVSASGAGLTLTASTITWATGAWLQARWHERIGPRRLIGVGLAIASAGIALVLPVLHESVPVVVAVVAWAVGGLGMGMAYPSITLLVMSLARPHEQGAATAAVQLSDQMGTALGAGVGGAILAFGAASGRDHVTTLSVVFAVMVAMVLVALAASGRVRTRDAGAAT